VKDGGVPSSRPAHSVGTGRADRLDPPRIALGAREVARCHHPVPHGSLQCQLIGFGGSELAVLKRGPSRGGQLSGDRRAVVR
jgi:hypothetical protein